MFACSRSIRFGYPARERISGALALAPDSVPLQRLEAISTAIRTRQTERAAALAGEELAHGGVHPLLFNARALWLAEQEQNEDALVYFRKADSMLAASAATKSAIGVCLTKLGKYEEAIAAFDGAIALQSDSAALHCRKGFAQEMAQDLAGARRSHERALELEPQNAEVLGRLAFLAARRGERGEAIAYADSSLASDSSHATAHIVKATVEIETGELEPAETRLTTLLADEGLSGHSRFLALGHLGDLRDRQDRIADAVAAYSAANAACRALHSDHFWAQGASLSGTVAALTSHFERNSDPTARDSASGGSHGAATHTFLLGFPRSGTTLTEQALASHPGVVTLEEKDLMADAVDRFMPRSGELAPLEDAPERALVPYRELYWQRVRNYGVEPTGKLFVDMGPMHTVKLPLIARLFPGAKILFSIRDPRDVVLSCFRRRFGINPTTFEFLTLESAARFYSAVMQLGTLCRTSLPLDVREIRYETLVDDFEGQLRKVCAFLGLSWNDNMLRFAERSKLDVITTVSASQVARGLNREGIGQWRRYREHLAPVLPILQPWIEEFGYPAE
jgi:tetratricopeptide (TPR) repeat protein